MNNDVLNSLVDETSLDFKLTLLHRWFGRIYTASADEIQFATYIFRMKVSINVN